MLLDVVVGSVEYCCVVFVVLYYLVDGVVEFGY